MSQADEITQVIQRHIASYGGATTEASMVSVGTVISVGDGIARIFGMEGVRYLELIEFPRTGIMGLAFNLEEETVSAPIMGDYTQIREGDEVRTTGRIIEVPVGDALLGRVVNALGEPIDSAGPVNTTKKRPAERVAPGVITRQSVSVPVQTGIKVVDALIPVGRGQRELIIGDRQTGKTALAVDTIINQKGKDLLCIYVSIGQRNFQITRLVETLRQAGALEYTIIVHASAEDPAPLKYLAPYTGCAMGEEFMESGRDALIIYDDLTKHAEAYRNMSLIIRRPPGREAFPGDVFYLHSRLLERAARLNKDYGGGSLTALPIVETKGNDVSAYIPTNVISITDGQIFLETDLFNAGQRPALNPGISVSRVGGDAQTPGMKQVSGTLKIDQAQYASLAAFAQFGSDLDAVTKSRLDRGARINEILKQPQYHPLAVEQQIMIIYITNKGYLDDVALPLVSKWETAFHRFMESTHPEIGKEIVETTVVNRKKVTEDTFKKLETATKEFKQSAAPRA